MSPTAWQKIVSNISTAATVYTLATEVVGVTLVVSDLSPDSTVHLFGIITCTTGVGATTGTPRIRRGGTGGTAVGAAPAITTPASSVVNLTTAGDDQPGDVASQTYSLTGTFAGVAATNILAYLMAVVG